MTNVSDKLQMVIPSKQLYILRSSDNGAECRYNSVICVSFSSPRPETGVNLNLCRLLLKVLNVVYYTGNKAIGGGRGLERQSDISFSHSLDDTAIVKHTGCLVWHTYAHFCSLLLSST